MKYADVILPLALPQNYTFGVPLEMQDTIQVGCRVEVQFGKRKIYSAIVKELHNRKPEAYIVKPIRSLLDTQPIVTPQQIQYWQWIAEYYMCTLGEVMSAALPSFMKLESETYIALNEEIEIEHDQLTDDEFIVLQALQIHGEKMKKKIKEG